jgi:hypothetical protein
MCCYCCNDTPWPGIVTSSFKMPILELSGSDQTVRLCVKKVVLRHLFMLRKGGGVSGRCVNIVGDTRHAYLGLGSDFHFLV